MIFFTTDTRDPEDTKQTKILRFFFSQLLQHHSLKWMQDIPASKMESKFL